MQNSPKKILLLEDDEILAQTLRQILKSANYDVVLAIDGEEALEFTYNNRFDMYLLDINVPIVSGIDFLKLLRDYGDETPAFFITALRDIDSLSKAFNSGCDDYIKKPFEIDELLIRIEHILKKKNPLIEYKNIKLDLFADKIYKDKEEIKLGLVEKAVFTLLLRNISIVVYKSALYDEMQKPSESGLRVLINKLRKIFDIEIISVKGIGYKIEKV